MLLADTRTGVLPGNPTLRICSPVETVCSRIGRTLSGGQCDLYRVCGQAVLTLAPPLRDRDHLCVMREAFS